MSETPQGEEARRLVDDLEEKHVDVQGAMDEQPDDVAAEDESESVPGSPEPTD
jgi:hypothetical protein